MLPRSITDTAAASSTAARAAPRRRAHPSVADFIAFLLWISKEAAGSSKLCCRFSYWTSTRAPFLNLFAAPVASSTDSISVTTTSLFLSTHSKHRSRSPTAGAPRRWADPVGLTPTTTTTPSSSASSRSRPIGASRVARLRSFERRTGSCCLGIVKRREAKGAAVDKSSRRSCFRRMASALAAAAMASGRTSGSSAVIVARRRHKSFAKESSGICSMAVRGAMRRLGRLVEASLAPSQASNLKFAFLNSTLKVSKSASDRRKGDKRNRRAVTPME
mmetsp:Transcript_32238/g.102789  ORF Transcript_32238/g.102789 Transcript_32238/m.102789 type:complete len:275 (-) Transcript_32238:1703-2527(-)